MPIDVSRHWRYRLWCPSGEAIRNDSDGSVDYDIRIVADFIVLN